MIKKIKSIIPIKTKANVKNFLKHLKTRSIKEISFKESFVRHNNQYLEEEAFERELAIHKKITMHTKSKEGILNNIYEYQDSVGYFLDKNLNITNVIDIGSGTGWFVNFVSSNYQSIKSIIAIEPSIAAIHISKRIYGENEKITYINGFADKAIKDLSKDVYLVTTFAVFQHLNILYTKRVLKSLNMVLKKNSVLIFKEPIANSKYERFNLHYPRSEKFWKKNLKNFEVNFFNNKLIVAKKVV